MLAISELTYQKMKYVEGYTIRKKQEIIRTIPPHYNLEVTTSNMKDITTLFLDAKKENILDELNELKKGANIIVIANISSFYGIEVIDISTNMEKIEEISSILYNHRKKRTLNKLLFTMVM
jgi:hypothetical protein